MANTRTIGASGKDHTTINSAITWGQSNHDFDTDGMFTMSVEDNSEYNEVIALSGWTGTPDVTSHPILTVASANRHAGVASTGHARLRGSTNGSHVVTIDKSWGVIEYLEIQQDSTGNSDEGIRVNNGTSAGGWLISRCIIWSDTATANQDGIYIGDKLVAIGLFVGHCAIYGFPRAGCHGQNFAGTFSQVWNIDYCTIYNCGAGIRMKDASSGSTTCNVYNTACLGNTDDFVEDDANVIWTGTHNASSDASLTTIGLTTNAQESLTTSDQLKNISAGSEDLHIKDTGATLYQNATDRVGSEPDARQDFSTDFEGDTRSTTLPDPDIGCDEFIAAVGGVTAQAQFLPLLGVG